MRYLAASLPRQQKGGLDGELMVVAYQRQLGNCSTEAIEFLIDEAQRTLDWFPTISQCLKILDRFEPRDRKLIQLCRTVSERERWERFNDMERAVRRGNCTEELIARLTDRQRVQAREAGLLRDDDTPRADAAWFTPLTEEESNATT